jgi:hypothetical protein
MFFAPSFRIPVNDGRQGGQRPDLPLDTKAIFSEEANL